MAKAKTKAVVAQKSTDPRRMDKVAIENGKLTITGVLEAQNGVSLAFASDSEDFVSYAFIQLVNILSKSDNDDLTTGMNAAVAMLRGIAPTNELEAMLAAQMVATHHLSMIMARRTASADQILQFEANGNMMAKFSRTFTAQMEALGKLRRGGEQIVRHVHVNEGGQAVIANTVNTGGRGNG